MHRHGAAPVELVGALKGHDNVPNTSQWCALMHWMAYKSP